MRATTTAAGSLPAGSGRARPPGPTRAPTRARRSSSASPSPRRASGRKRVYRWERATQIDPTYAAAFNNLAIAHEQQGEFEKARKAYEKAVELEPDNTLIRQNYDLFKEINDRTTRGSDR